MKFAEFAKQHLNTVAFEPDFDLQKEQVFAASLGSFRDLARAVDGVTNAAGMMLSIDAGFVETMTPNAFASYHDGVHHVGMHSALMATILELALFVFTQATIFPGVGDASKETSPSFGADDVPGMYLLKTTLAERKVDPQQDKGRIPIDPDRYVAAVYLAVLMSRFVWMHELAHCLAGHVLLVQDLQIASTVNEVSEPLRLVGIHDRKRAEEARRVRHEIEFEADRIAIVNLLQVQLDGRENIPGLLSYDEMTRIEMAILGAYLMTWLFQEYQNFMDSQHGLTHPNPAIRFLSLKSYLLEIAPDFVMVDEKIESMLKELCKKLPRLTETVGATKLPKDQNLSQSRPELAQLRFSQR